MVADDRRGQPKEVHGLDRGTAGDQIRGQGALELVPGVEPDRGAPALARQTVHHPLDRRDSTDRPAVRPGIPLGLQGAVKVIDREHAEQNRVRREGQNRGQGQGVQH